LRPNDLFAGKFEILVADDSPIYRKLVKDALSEDEYTVIFAKNGREASDLYAEHQPAVVISDWEMPDLSGIDLCRHIRREKDLYTYIILLTSKADKDQIISGLAAGADDYLTKPFHPGELLARVAVGQRIVGLHREIQAKNRLLAELALTDPLTGLPNRRAVEDWGNRQLSGASRHGFAVWLVMADLDSFKAINDTYGHEAGDSVLKRFAELLKANTRASNMCGRLGGEEFVVILTHIDQFRVGVAIDRFRRQFEAERFTFGTENVSVTASFGIAGFQGSESPDFSQLVRAADSALYAAKRAGRNRLEFASEVITKP
jgi:diguanylate cyclase (GGDEF)-like protein